MNYKTPWHVCSGKILLEVTIWDKNNGSKDSSDITTFLLLKECTDFKDDISSHIPNIEKTRGKKPKFKLVLCNSLCHHTIV